MEGPFDQHWTIEELLVTLSAVDSPNDALAPVLSDIERALCEAAGAPPWQRSPSAAALLRSIALLCARTPALRAVPLARVLAGNRAPVLT